MGQFPRHASDRGFLEAFVNIHGASVAFLDWYPVPAITANPAALAPAFAFLGQPEPLYPPRDLPVWKTLGKVTPLAQQVVAGRNTGRYWSIIGPHLPVRVVPELGIAWSGAGTKFSNFHFRVWIHSFGIVSVLSCDVEAEPQIDDGALRRNLIRLDQGDSFRLSCRALIRCRSVRALFQKTRALVLEQVLTVKTDIAAFDWISDRPYCMVMPRDGDFPRTREELQSNPADCAAMHALLERATRVATSTRDTKERWAVDYGRAARSGAVTGWTFLSMNGIGSYIDGEGAVDSEVMAARDCHSHNLTTVIGIYRLAHAYLSAISARPGAVPDHFVHYGARMVKRIRVEYPTWSTRWLNARLRDRDSVNSLVAQFEGADRTTDRGVFVSYAHEDEAWRGRFRTMLGGAIQQRRVALYDDRTLQASDGWDDMLQSWIRQSSAAVLFVTAEFFASEYIFKTEMPLLLEARKSGRLKIYWVLIGPAVLRGTPLEGIQSAADPEKPWRALSEDEQQLQLALLADQVLNNL